MNEAPRAFSSGPQVVAVTGACTPLGKLLLSRLDDDPHVRQIVALDVREPEIDSDKLRFGRIDLTSPTAGSEISSALGTFGVDSFVHGAFLSHATHAFDWAHELEDVGTMHVLNACSRARPARFVLLSTTLVYGPASGNPNFLTEDAPLAGLAECPFVADKLAADRQVARFADEHPETAVTTLRFAPILGPLSSNVFTRFLARPVSPSVAGFDPLMQVLHEQDAADAAYLALLSSVRGAINIAAPGVLPYSTVLACLGRIRVPLPFAVARALGRALWSTQIIDTPPALVDLLRDLCVADTGRAERELGFRPRYSIRQTLDEFLGLSEEVQSFAPAAG